MRVMRKPVEAPATAVTAEQVIRRRPEVVAEVKRTAWKKSGLDELGVRNV